MKASILLTATVLVASVLGAPADPKAQPTPELSHSSPIRAAAPEDSFVKLTAEMAQENVHPAGWKLGGKRRDTVPGTRLVLLLSPKLRLLTSRCSLNKRDYYWLEVYSDANFAGNWLLYTNLQTGTCYDLPENFNDVISSEQHSQPHSCRFYK